MHRTSMGSDAWKFWYTRKKGTVEPEVSKLGDFLSENRNPKILDFGCGAGRHLVYYAKRGFEVFGFDASETAIKRARKALKKEKLCADLRVWDMKRPLPYEDSFFDAVMATRVMHHTYMDSIKRMAKEINRVLKEGGFLLLQVPAFSEQAALKWKMEGLKSEEPEPRTYIYSDGEERGVPHHHFTKEELLGLFENYSVEELHSGTEHYGGYCLMARKNKR